LRGLERVLPQPLSPETWAAILRDVAKGAKALLPLPKVIEDFLSEPAPAMGMLESVAASLFEILNNVKHSKSGDAGPLSIVIDAMVKELGAGEASDRG
jgi:hypothetical protein